ncbi:pentatricopeptide repeat-containing protein At4g02750 [Selaginella moellendorffii]|uniref:pentatricopeptide repeat-containing protein At4g02750 n=1 Tax=Selaginella moellendorffii TaxID=88036 RepID=UPI000D1CD775|nr:pentatricopeptide repeat-containing protein At4g02750 [Selaginella moellendorffii]|eukprot:XP_024540201.1 pentatricopeptide repeat-containing protein At4g02750 [Selaginella moellendorffii]
MYGSCGDVDRAKKAFDRIDSRNVFSGNVMIAAYAQNGHLLEAASVFQRVPETNVVSWNSMIAAYAQHGDLYESRKLFDTIPEKNTVSWNSMIAGYAQNAFSKEALKLFKAMDLQGFQPNKVTFVSALDAAGNLGALPEGSAIHEEVLEHDCETDTAVATALINFFGKCRMVAKSREIFNSSAIQRNTVTWTTMISVYAHNGFLDEAQKLFDVAPRPSTVTWNVLMAAYCQSGDPHQVQAIFDRMRDRDDVSWSTLVGAYAQSNQHRTSMELFKKMDVEGYKPTRFTFMSVVDACGKLSALREGRVLHSSIMNSALKWDVVLQNGIVNMFGRCGSVEESSSAFQEMLQRDAVSWSIMISAFAHNGHGAEALETFLAMNLDGQTPDELTFVSILSVCAHAGLLRDARGHLVDMVGDYALVPGLDHYVCLVDLLCRSGRLGAAEELVETMPYEPHGSAWLTLLAACKMQGDLKRGARVGKSFLATDPDTSAPYALLSSIYAEAKRVNEMRIVRKAMEERGIKKQAGCSYIEVHDRVHEFKAGEVSHPRHRDILYELMQIQRKMVEAGCVRDTRLVSYDLEEEEKENLLTYHSEKLAIGLGLVTTRPGTELRVVKNLRVCSDCHTAIKFISRICGRRIVVRDCNRFHHFEDGVCSCNDYW